MVGSHKHLNQKNKRALREIQLLSFLNDDVPWYIHSERILSGGLISGVRFLWLDYRVKRQITHTGSADPVLEKESTDAMLEYKFFQKPSRGFRQGLTSLIPKGVTPRMARYAAIGGLINESGIREPTSTHYGLLLIGSVITVLAILGFFDMALAISQFNVDLRTKVLATGGFALWLGPLTFALASVFIMPSIAAIKIKDLTAPLL